MVRFQKLNHKMKNVVVSSIIDYNYSLVIFFFEFDFLLLMIVLFRLIAFSNISLKSVIY